MLFGAHAPCDGANIFAVEIARVYIEARRHRRARRPAAEGAQAEANNVISRP